MTEMPSQEDKIMVVLTMLVLVVVMGFPFLLLRKPDYGIPLSKTSPTRYLVFAEIGKRLHVSGNWWMFDPIVYCGVENGKLVFGLPSVHPIFSPTYVYVPAKVGESFVIYNYNLTIVSLDPLTVRVSFSD